MAASADYAFSFFGDVVAFSWLSIHPAQHAPDPKHWTPLHWAVFDEEPPSVIEQVIAQNSSIVNLQDYLGYSPLLLAVKFNYRPDVIEYFLKLDDIGVDVEISEKGSSDNRYMPMPQKTVKMTLLHLIIEHSSFKDILNFLKLVRARKKEIFSLDSNQCILHKYFIRLLCEAGIGDKKSFFLNQHKDYIQKTLDFMVESGASLNARNPIGQTPLEWLKGAGEDFGEFYISSNNGVVSRMV